MKKILLFISIFCGSFTYSQSSPQIIIDSLVSVYNKEQKTTSKIDLLYQISKTYLKIDLDKSTKYSNQLLLLSQKTKNEKGIGQYHLVTSMLDDISGKYEDCLINANKASAIFKKIKDVEYYLDATYFRAVGNLDLGKVDEAKKIAIQGLKEAKGTKYYKQLGKLNFSLGGIYYTESNFNEAQKHFIEAVRFFRITKSNDLIANGYRLIAAIYVKTNQFEKAAEYAELALEILKNDTNSKQYSMVLAVASFAQKNLKNYSKALSYAKNALEIDEKFGNVDDILTSSNMITLIYVDMAEHDKVIETCNYAIKKYGKSPYIINCYINLSKGYNGKKDFKNAQITQQKGLSLMPENYDKDSQINFYKDIAKTEYFLGNYKNAYTFQEKFSKMEREMLLDEKENRLNELEAKFDSNEKNLTISNLKLSKKQKELENLKQKNYLNFLLFLLSTAILILGFVIWMYKLINTKKIALEKSELLIKRSLKEKELLLKEIHHRVKNNLQLVMSLLNIQAREGETKDINDFLEKGQSRIISMALIHENLYQTERLDKVNFQDYIENLVSNIKQTFGDQYKDITTVVNAKNTSFDIQTSIPLGLIINELFCNTLKHAFPENYSGKVTIELEENENKEFQLIISDNGVGIKDSINKKKTLGLELVYLLVSQLKGTQKCYEDHGTTYCINFKEIA